MSLSENSLKFIKMLYDDPEKLKKLKSFSSEEEIYDYIASMVPNYTKEDFENLKNALYKLEESGQPGKQLLSDEQELAVSGGSFGSFLDKTEELTDAYSKGKSSMGDISIIINSIANAISNLADSYKRKKELEKLKTQDEKKI